MSMHDLDYLNSQTLVGYALDRGNAWTWRKGTNNHFDYEVPMERVKELLSWSPREVVIEEMIVELLQAMPVGEARKALAQKYGFLNWDGRKAIAHPNQGNVFGIFKEGYTAHDFDEWLVNNVSTLLDDELRVGSAGLLKFGAVAWVSVEMPDTIATPEGELFRPSLLACTSHDGSLSTTYKKVITRVVCDNTLGCALMENGDQVKVRHSKKSLDKVQDVRDALGIIHQMTDDFSKQIAEMCATTVNDKQWSQFLEAHVPIEKDAKANAITVAETKRDALTTLWNADSRVEPWKNTKWGAIQAVNTFTQHETRVNKNTIRAEKNMMQTLNGGIDKIDAAAITLLDNILANV